MFVPADVAKLFDLDLSLGKHERFLLNIALDSWHTADLSNTYLTPKHGVMEILLD